MNASSTPSVPEGIFTWKPVFRAMAERLLEYRDQQDVLLGWLREMKEAGMEVIRLVDKDGSTPLNEIDPFTFLANINRGLKWEKRIEIARELMARLGIADTPPPSDFFGIPVVDHRKAWFFSFEADRNPEDVTVLWAIAEQALRKDPQDLDPDLYQRCLDIRGVGMAYLTMALFWIRPDRYLALDSVNTDYLAEQGVPERVLAARDLDGYRKALAEVHQRVGEDHAMISLAAYYRPAPMELSDEELDGRFEGFMAEWAKVNGCSPEELARTLASLKEPDPNAEIGNRLTTFPALAERLRSPNLTAEQLGTEIKRVWALGGQYDSMKWGQFLKAPEALDDIRNLLDDAAGIPLGARIERFVLDAAAHGYRGKKAEDPPAVLLFASVLASAVYPEDAVDFRAQRWKRFYKRVAGESKTPFRNSSVHSLLGAGLFARKLALTPSFRRLFGEDHGTWIAAGLSWFFRNREAGFPEITGEDKPKYWVFQANLGRYDLAGSLRSGVLDRWTVNQHADHIGEGDGVILWGTGKEGGCFGLARVVSRPGTMEENPEETAFWSKPPEQGAYVGVALKIEATCEDQPIPRQALEEADFTDFKGGQQGTNLPATKAQFETLLAIITGQGMQDRPRVWLYSPGRGGERWPECQEKSEIMLGWPAVGDLSQYQSKEDVRAAVVGAGSDSDNPYITVHALWQFRHEMARGDIVIPKKGLQTFLGWGFVTGDYRYDESDPEMPHRRAVEWRSTDEREEDRGTTVVKTLTDVTPWAAYVVRLRRLLGIDSLPEPEDTPAELPEIPVPLNLILYGPPGTGKTFRMNELAKAHFTDADTGADARRFEFVTFHPSFSYEDFVEGIRPVLGGAGEPRLRYELKRGKFREMCARAERDPGRRYALFIDEINRGNVASIFGELITLLEEDKRLGQENEVKVRLPYSGDPFGVPSNLHVIGTMNTADRSVIALDTALRRRFRFEELEPNPSVVPEGTVDGVDLRKLLDAINARIERLLDRDHRIGHSYLMEVKSLDDLRTAFAAHIVPLLQEYFYNDYGRIGMVLGPEFVGKVQTGGAGLHPGWGEQDAEAREIYCLTPQEDWTAEVFESIYAETRP